VTVRVLEGACPPQERVALRAVDVSVCIANWNCRDLLRQCLHSLRQAKGVSVEVIVVDNASSDGAPDMVESDFAEVRLLRNSRNLGFSRANNQAARAARGRYLFFLNNDTIVPPGTLCELIDFLDANPDVGMVGPRLCDAHGQRQASSRRRPTLTTFLARTYVMRWARLFRGRYRRFRRPELEDGGPQRVEVLMGAALCLPRERFLAWGGWDETFTFGGEDVELSDRVNRHAQVAYLPTAEVVHFGRESTRQNISFATPHIAVGFGQYLRKAGCSRWGLLAYKLALTLDAPLQLVLKTGQYVFRSLLGRHETAAKSLNVVRGTWAFLGKGLIPLWKI
jgi:N-acetylglucosaminyl-diphospho-decaprenol L-rhamnosyltransferase